MTILDLRYFNLPIDQTFLRFRWKMWKYFFFIFLSKRFRLSYGMLRVKCFIKYFFLGFSFENKLSKYTFLSQRQYFLSCTVVSFLDVLFHSALSFFDEEVLPPFSLRQLIVVCLQPDFHSLSQVLHPVYA